MILYTSDHPFYSDYYHLFLPSLRIERTVHKFVASNINSDLEDQVPVWIVPLEIVVSLLYRSEESKQIQGSVVCEHNYPDGLFIITTIEYH